MVDVRDSLRFLRNTADIGILAASANVLVDTETLRQEFGHNLNTIIIANNAAEEISLTLDGHKIAFIDGNGGIFALDWRDGINFSMIAIINEDGSATSANEIRISVGRTGPSKELVGLS